MPANKSNQQNAPANKTWLNAGIAIFSVFATLAGWGFLNGRVNDQDQATEASRVRPANATTAKEGNEREALLGEARSEKKKTNGESNILFNDPFIQNKWGLERTSAQRAWEITQGSKDIVVAVIDTGIDVDHKDLAANLWENPGETGVVDNELCRRMKAPLEVRDCNKAINGKDDDGNGFTDDVHGWNFVHNNHSLTDNHNHGTHISGIIGAKGGNGFGISGVSPNVSIMTLKYYDPKASNTNNLKNTIQAIRYAIKMKANIINYSGGGTDYSAEEYAAVKEAERAGILFIAAAGNERSNSDEAGKHYYPADYDLTNVISVTAVNKEETKVLASSNYGVRTVDLAAPGENIYSTLPGNSFGVMTGTSQATAFVTGVAALIMAHNSEFKANDIKKYILRTGDEYSTLLSKTGTAKLLNSYKALTSLDKGVSATGVVAANTAKVGARAFAADQNLKNQKFNVSALNNTGAVGDENEEPAEAIAMFGRNFLKAVEDGRVKGLEAQQELRRR